MRNHPFYDEDFAISRLSGCVIRIDKVPCYVSIVRVRSHRLTMSYYPITVRNEDLWIDWDPTRIELTPVPLGLVNIKNACVNTMRVPARMWKIGLTTRNLGASYLPEAGAPHVSTDRLLLSPELNNTIMGDFPSFKKALTKTAEKAMSCAFSRSFAVTSSGYLLHRFKGIVGRVVKDEPVLYPSFMYLKEVLEGDLR